MLIARTTSLDAVNSKGLSALSYSIQINAM